MLLKRFVRKGRYGDRTFTFTHWNPKNNMAWGEDIPCGKDQWGRVIYGAWVPSDKILFL